ncbi:MAG: D-alanyl-D-alanine carboxypeptidase/D-alanyl-D-alanine endopeptidase [Nocardioidaceae bacterium]
MSRGRVILIAALAFVVLATAGGLAWWGGLFESDDEPVESALEVAPPEGLELPAARTPEPVLPAPDGPAVSNAALRSRVAPLLGDADLGRHVGFAAYDLTHGRPLWTSGGGEPYIPASTLKLFTGTAALEAIGGDQVFTTSTVLRPARRNEPAQVVLVGGGDPLLSSLSPRAADKLYPRPATLGELADATVSALEEQRVRRVAIGYDASRYAGPSDNPTWEPDYVPDEVPPISPLWVDEGTNPANPYAAVLDPASSAAEAFATELVDRGIKLVGAPTAAPGATGQPLGAVDSAPLRDIVGHVLDTSDNAGAEILLREVGIATGRPGSFVGGVDGVREVLGGLGVPMRGIETFDGSGLSRANRVTLESLLAVLQVASDERHPELRDAVTRLPVAGYTGTLESRFIGDGADAGLGVVRAKTGTLSHVHGLAGTVVDRDGVAVAFVALVDRVPLQDTLDARGILDDIAAAVASCGCRR